MRFGCGQKTQLNASSSATAALPVCEIENFVSDNLPTCARPVLVISEPWRSLGGSEELSGVENPVAHEFINDSMKIVAAATAHEFKACGSVSGRCIHQVRIYLELRDRIERQRDRRVIQIPHGEIHSVKRGARREISDAAEI